MPNFPNFAHLGLTREKHPDKARCRKTGESSFCHSYSSVSGCLATQSLSPPAGWRRAEHHYNFIINA